MPKQSKSQKAVTSTYITSASSSSEDFNADCDFALVTFTPALLRKLRDAKRAYLRMSKDVKGLTECTFRDTHGAFIARKAAEKLLGEDLLEDIESSSGEGPTKVPEDTKNTSGNAPETPFDVLCVTDGGVWWQAFPDHTSILVSSSFIPWTWFERCTRCRNPKAEHAKGKCLFEATRYHAFYPELAL